MEDILLLNKYFFRLSIRALVAHTNGIGVHESRRFYACISCIAGRQDDNSFAILASSADADVTAVSPADRQVASTTALASTGGDRATRNVGVLADSRMRHCSSRLACSRDR